jgi:hypothetical protein
MMNFNKAVRFLRIIPLAALIASGFFTGCRREVVSAADIILRNGFINTADLRNVRADALAIKDGKFVYVGTNDGVKSYESKATRIIDLDGRMVLPGFIDSHSHPTGMVKQLFAVSLYGLGSIQAYQKAVVDFAKAHPSAKAIRGSGWSNPLFPKTGPDRKMLDVIIKDIPVALSSEDGHSTWVNSKTLELAGITRKTPNPPGGVIERDPMTGEPNGTLREKAAGLATKIFPAYSVEELAKGLEAYQEMALSLGITTAHESSVGAGGSDIQAYKLLEKEGRLRMRFRASLHVDPGEGLEQIGSLVAEREKNKGPLFQTNAAKIFIDGVVEGGTAYLKEPYLHKPGYRGEFLWKADALDKMCAELDRLGFQLHFHAIGDAAVAETLDAFAYAAGTNGKRDARPIITHLQLVSPQDILRFRQLSVVAVTQPYWFMKDDYYYLIQVPYLGQERADREYPMESFYKEGVVVASSSDYPVTIPCNPLQAIQIGMTRSRPDTKDPKEVLWPEEKATLDQMIAGFTWNGAYANFLERVTGSIEVGKSADLVVLDGNLFDIPASEIGKIEVRLTFFEGREAYRDKSFVLAPANGSQR